MLATRRSPSLSANTPSALLSAPTRRGIRIPRRMPSGARPFMQRASFNAEWYVTDVPRLAEYAARYRMLVVMANHAASLGTYTSVGRSAVWSPGGAVLVQSEGTESALLIAEHRDGTWCGQIAKLEST